MVAISLEVASDEIIESLVCAAEFDIGFYDDRIIGLHQGVEELVYADWPARFVANLEGIALEHPGHCHGTGELDNVGEVQLGKRFGIVANLEFFFGCVEDFPRLGEIGFCVLLDLLIGKDRPGAVLP